MAAISQFVNRETAMLTRTTPWLLHIIRTYQAFLPIYIALVGMFASMYEQVPYELTNWIFIYNVFIDDSIDN